MLWGTYRFKPCGYMCACVCTDVHLMSIQNTAWLKRKEAKTDDTLPVFLWERWLA